MRTIVGFPWDGIGNRQFGSFLSRELKRRTTKPERPLVAVHRHGNYGSMTDEANDVDEIWDEWKRSVTMTAGEIESWLETDESKSVGQKPDGGGESVGHRSGRRIVTILRTKKANLTALDVEHMHKVVNYVKRQGAQGPGSDVEHSRWRYSLMNWGNDPLKKV